MSLMKKSFNPQLIFQRYKTYNWYNEGLKYYGFKYYPRKDDFKDPPCEPSKLFRVERIKPLKGVPHPQKKILNEFQLDKEKNNCYSIVKNIPENNHRLWKIKHLVKILPITFPDGFPKKTDVTYLKENGELCIIKDVTNLNKKMELRDSFHSDVKKLDGDTLRRQSRAKWMTGWDTTM